MTIFRNAIIAGAMTCSLGAAYAAGPDYLSEGRDASRRARAQEHSNGVDANNRCHGMSYGTGARSCGTASGGPVGGIGGRN